jgi:hypothetical protein
LQAESIKRIAKMMLKKVIDLFINFSFIAVARDRADFIGFSTSIVLQASHSFKYTYDTKFG